MFVLDLLEFPDEAIAKALARVRRECPKFTLRDVLDRLGVVQGKELIEAEARIAWDAAIKFSEKYVHRTPEGESWTARPARGCPDPPDLGPRILDSVRRVGGWSAFKSMDDTDFPHLQRRFIDEFVRWEGVEQVRAALPDGVAAGVRMLAGKTIEPSPEQFEQRKRLLRSQAESLTPDSGAGGANGTTD